MDEPTNHLDLEGILWLEAVLKQAPFAFVLVSHDRSFLESVTNRIVELNRLYPDGYLRVEGNYSAFIEKRANSSPGPRTGRRPCFRTRPAGKSSGCAAAPRPAGPRPSTGSTAPTSSRTSWARSGSATP